MLRRCLLDAADRTGFARMVGCYEKFRSASLMSVRSGVDGRRTATEWSAVISLAIYGACREVSRGTGGTGACGVMTGARLTPLSWEGGHIGSE